MLNGNELMYAITIIMKIAFPSEEIAFLDSNIIEFKNYKIKFNIMDEENYYKLLNGTIDFTNIYNYNNKFKIPIYLQYKNQKFLEINDKTINVNADIITLSFLLLSRKEELLIGKFDNHERFLYEGSLSYMYNIIKFPIVDEYAFLLRKSIQQYIQIAVIDEKTNIYLTHDVDNLFRFSNIFKNIKTIVGGDLILRKDIKLFWDSIKSLIKYKKNPMNDQRIEAVYKLINLSKQYNLYSHFFFLCYNKIDKDYRYDIFDKRVKKIIDDITNNSMYVGLHTGKNANNDIKNFRDQYNKLKQYTNVRENRNHYLMFNALNTVDIFEKNDIKIDYSLGYREMTGFKCGTSHDFPLYNLKENRISKVIERPLIVMDGTLKMQMKLSENEAIEETINLYDSAQNVSGNFTILWHPDSVIREWKYWFENVYIKILEELNEKNNSNL